MMKWSIFESKNQATLDDVRSKYGVSTERLSELKVALEKTKLRVARYEQVDTDLRREAELALKNAVRGAHFDSRKEMLQAFNQGALKAAVADLMQKGLVVVYVNEVSAKVGATKVYTLKKDRSGRIKLLAATPNNPQEAVNSGLYSASIIESDKRVFSGYLNSRMSLRRVVAGAGSRKTQKPRIHFEAEINVECGI